MHFRFRTQATHITAERRLLSFAITPAPEQPEKIDVAAKRKQLSDIINADSQMNKELKETVTDLIKKQSADANIVESSKKTIMDVVKEKDAWKKLPNPDKVAIRQAIPEDYREFLDFVIKANLLDDEVADGELQKFKAQRPAHMNDVSNEHAEAVDADSEALIGRFRDYQKRRRANDYAQQKNKGKLTMEVKAEREALNEENRAIVQELKRAFGENWSYVLREIDHQKAVARRAQILLKEEQGRRHDAEMGRTSGRVRFASLDDNEEIAMGNIRRLKPRPPNDPYTQAYSGIIREANIIRGERVDETQIPRYEVKQNPRLQRKRADGSGGYRNMNSDYQAWSKGELTDAEKRRFDRVSDTYNAMMDAVEKLEKAYPDYAQAKSYNLLKENVKRVTSGISNLNEKSNVLKTIIQLTQTVSAQMEAMKMLQANVAAMEGIASKKETLPIMPQLETRVFVKNLSTEKEVSFRPHALFDGVQADVNTVKQLASEGIIVVLNRGEKVYEGTSFGRPESMTVGLLPSVHDRISIQATGIENKKTVKKEVTLSVVVHAPAPTNGAAPAPEASQTPNAAVNSTMTPGPQTTVPQSEGGASVNNAYHAETMTYSSPQSTQEATPAQSVAPNVRDLFQRARRAINRTASVAPAADAATPEGPATPPIPPIPESVPAPTQPSAPDIPVTTTRAARGDDVNNVEWKKTMRFSDKTASTSPAESSPVQKNTPTPAAENPEPPVLPEFAPEPTQVRERIFKKAADDLKKSKVTTNEVVAPVTSTPPAVEDMRSTKNAQRKLREDEIRKEAKNNRIQENRKVAAALEANEELMADLSVDTLQLEEAMDALEQFRQNPSYPLDRAKELAEKVVKFQDLHEWMQRESPQKWSNSPSWEFASQKESATEREKDITQMIGRRVYRALSDGTLREEDISEYLKKVKKWPDSKIKTFVPALRAKLKDDTENPEPLASGMPGATSAERPNEPRPSLAADRIPVAGDMFAAEPHVYTYPEKQEIKKNLDAAWNPHSVLHSPLFTKQEQEAVTKLAFNTPANTPNQPAPEAVQLAVRIGAYQPLHEWITRRGMGWNKFKNAIKVRKDLPTSQTYEEKTELGASARTLLGKIETGAITDADLWQYATKVLGVPDYNYSMFKPAFLKMLKKEVQEEKERLAREEPLVEPVFAETEEEEKNRLLFEQESMDTAEFLKTQGDMLALFEKLPADTKTEWFVLTQLTNEQQNGKAAIGFHTQEMLDAAQNLLGHPIDGHWAKEPSGFTYFRFKHPEQMVTQIYQRIYGKYMNPRPPQTILSQEQTTRAPLQKASLKPANGVSFSNEELSRMADVFYGKLQQSGMNVSRAPIGRDIIVTGEKGAKVTLTSQPNGHFAVQGDNPNQTFMLNDGQTENRTISFFPTPVITGLNGEQQALVRTLEKALREARYVDRILPLPRKPKLS